MRHDIGAKAKTLTDADRARSLVEDLDLQMDAGRFLIRIQEKNGGKLDDQLIESVAHDLIRRVTAAVAAQRRAT